MKVQNKNIKKRSVAVVLVGLLCVFTCLNTNAATVGEGNVIPTSMDVSTSVALSISSTGTATSTCTVTGKTGITTKISITMTLQKKAGSGKYYAVDTWSGTKSDSYYKMKKTSDVSKGTYRVMAKVTCYEGSVSETIYKYSGTKTY